MPGIPEGILPDKPSARSGIEPPSGVQGAGTIDRPYDQGNQPEQAAGQGIEPPSGQTGPGTLDRPYDQGNQPENDPISAPTSTTTTTAASDERRGRSDNKPTTDNSRLNVHPRTQERSVSPGQLDDGTHAVTSGQRGEGYTPGGGNLGQKLKGKLHIGGHR